MIEVHISEERIQQLLDAGVTTVVSPLGKPEPVFMFSGPGLSIARLAYTDELPQLAYSATDQSLWDVAILRPEPKRPTSASGFLERLKQRQQANNAAAASPAPNQEGTQP
jgi:hypothetical protein